MSDRISIVHLITELGTGGAQVALFRLLAGLDRDRFVLNVACLYHGDGAVAGQIRALGIPVTDLGMAGKARLDALWRLDRLLRRERPLVLHSWMFHANLAGRLVGRGAGVPVVITSRRNVNIGGGWRERCKRWTAGLDEGVIAVCEGARQAEIERTGVLPDKVVTVYNGVDLPFVVPDPQAVARMRRAFGVPTQGLLVGTVGRLHPQKGFASLLAAVARVRERLPAIRLLLVGDGALRRDLVARAEALGLAEVVTFAGSRGDVPEILAALDLFVLPSLWEGLPNAVLEAMAAGLPVVATAAGGTPELVVDGETGLLVPPGDVTALAEAIERLLRDAGLRRKMGEAGRKRVEGHFTIEQTVAQTVALYETLLRQKGLWV